jgi:hypothetical protein
MIKETIYVVVLNDKPFIAFSDRSEAETEMQNPDYDLTPDDFYIEEITLWRN